MLRKFSTVGVFTIMMALIVLFSCNDDHKIPVIDGGPIKFDTSRAAKSIIPIDLAVSFQKSFIATRSEIGKIIKDTNYLPKNFNLPNGEAFTKDAILLLLSQKDADGIRLYYGKDSKGVIRLVLLPVRKDGSVIYNKLIAPGKTADSTQMSIQGNSAEAIETGQTCPPCLIEPQDQ